MKHLSLCISLFLASFFVSSCTTPRLHVRSEYYSRQDLASYALDTPDPKKNSSDFGQRLIISWAVPQKIFEEGPMELVLNVRLKNGEEKITRIVLTKREGRTFYPIFGKDYTKKGGLQSYMAKIESQGKVLTKSRHKLWVEKIK